MYSQRDANWSNTLLGNSSSSAIGNYGCYLTSMAELITWAGGAVNPPELNEKLKAAGYFSDDIINNRQAPSLLYPELLEWGGSTEWSGAANLSACALDDNTRYIALIDSTQSQSGLQSHFVLVVGTTGSDLVILDPWTGTEKMLSVYGDPATVLYRIDKFIKKGEENMAAVQGDGIAHPKAEDVTWVFNKTQDVDPAQGDLDTYTTHNWCDLTYQNIEILRKRMILHRDERDFVTKVLHEEAWPLITTLKEELATAQIDTTKLDDVIKLLETINTKMSITN